MKLRAHFDEAMRQLRSFKLRSVLAVLGILVGTASVVAMVSIGELAEQQILMQFEQLGINLLSVSVYSTDDSNSVNPNASLSLHSIQNLPTASDNIQISAPYVNHYSSIVYQGQAINGVVVGKTTELTTLAGLKIARGRVLSFLDEHHYYCVIGDTIRQQLLQTGVSDPIGTQINIGGNIFTIVGEFSPWAVNWFFNADFNQAILIPLTTALSMEKNPKIDQIVVRIKDTTLLDQTSERIKTYIKAHTIGQEVSIRSPKSIVDSMKQSSRTMSILLGLVGSISLLVGGIGVMNIMLVSVAERQREIGVRMAVGATSRDIELQFLCEAVLLSVLGGAGGVLLGVLITYGVSLYSHWVFSLFLLPPLIGGLVSICTGVFFGFYPARQAAKLNPIVTLRSA